MVGARGRGKFGWKLLLVGPWARGDGHTTRRRGDSDGDRVIG